LNEENADKLQEMLGDLEAARGAPVRMVDLSYEARRIDNHHVWRGHARELNHYAAGTTVEDFATKGISIFSRAWAQIDGNTDYVEWLSTEYLAANDVIDQWQRRYETGRRNKPVTFPLEVYGRTREQTEAIEGATPVIWHDKPIGEIHENGRVMFLSLDYRNLITYGIIKWHEIINEPLLAAADPELLAQFAEQQRQKARQAFALMMKDRGNTAITEARKMMDQFALEAAEMQEKVVNALGNRDQYARQLTFLLEQEGDLTDEMVRQEWDGIENNVMIERFTAGEGTWTPHFAERQQPNPWLKVFTKDLWITNPDNGRKMPLGKYQVTMNFGENTLRIRNLTLRQTGGDAFNYREGDQWDHPHVKNEKLCTAEYATAITQLLRDRKLAQMTNMMFSILATVTLNDDWGRANIRLWEQADDELRRERGWPEWQDGETEHPMLANEEGGDDA
jgi:hypothetical protein